MGHCFHGLSLCVRLGTNGSLLDSPDGTAPRILVYDGEDGAGLWEAGEASSFGLRLETPTTCGALLFQDSWAGG